MMHTTSRQLEPTTRSIAGACPSCGNRELEIIYRTPPIPVHSCILLSSRAEARRFPRGDLELAFCDACGMIFNRRFDPSVIAYSDQFEESQHFSDTFNRFARQLAADIAQTCNLRDKRVVEIGCGKGEFLIDLCRQGQCTGVGIDPGYRPDRFDEAPPKNVRFIAGFFGPEYERHPADVVLCRHTLEHIPDTEHFVDAIHRMSYDDDDQVIVFETPDVLRVLQEGAFWDVYYEHCSYFSPGSHARLFRRCGFEIDRLELVYDGQYILQYARRSGAGETRTSPAPLEDDLDDLGRLAREFAQRTADKQALWRRQISRRAAAGQRVVLWGGGSKAVSFLTTLGLGREIDFVVDVNPYKQGKFLPASGHEVVSPLQLKQRPPASVIVMNQIYLPEVKQMLGELGLAPEVMRV